MSSTVEHVYTRKELFDALESDGLNITTNTIRNAKEGDGKALNSIGWDYQHLKGQDDKALAWYRLSAQTHHQSGQNNLGFMYHFGKGVPVDYLLAMEWYIKSAKQGNKRTFVHIGELFENGHGVWVNKYKAAEWYLQYDGFGNDFTRLNIEGVALSTEDKTKAIEQLIKETEDIFHKERKKQLRVKEQNRQFLQLNNTIRQEFRSNTDKINDLEKEIISMRNSFQQELSSLKRSNENWERMLEQERRLKDNEIKLIKQDMELQLKKEKQHNRRLNKENLALKSRLKRMNISMNETNSSAGGNHIESEDGSDPNNDINYDTE